MRPIFQTTVSKRDLITDLRAAGIERGDVLLIHSSLKRVGWILGGVEAMIDALEEVLGPEGTLVMPTFSFNLQSWRMPPYCATKTPSRVGRLTDTFWRDMDVLRSNHPTHSFAARGRLAKEIIQTPLQYEPLGAGSPADMVRLMGGKILLLGVGNNRNSTVHLAESLARMPYLRVPFSQVDPYDSATLIDEDGTLHHVVIREMPGSSEGFSILDEHLLRRGVARPCLIGAANSYIMRSDKLCVEVESLLRSNPLVFLNHQFASEISLRRRQFLATHPILGNGAGIPAQN